MGIESSLQGYGLATYGVYLSQNGQESFSK
jgi:hypothetical protein